MTATPRPLPSGSSRPAAATPPGAGTTLTARCPEDLLALVPVVVGFWPVESVAMLTFGAQHPFHARVDLPTAAQAREGALDELADALLEPARRHRVRKVAFVVYTDDGRLARDAARVLGGAFGEAGIDVLVMLRADGRRWYSLPDRRAGVPEWGVPYDVSSHPFVVEAVLQGRVTLESREELAASLAPSPERVAAVAGQLAAYPGEWSQQALPSTAEILREGGWAEDAVRRHVAAGSVPDDEEAARLLRGIQVKRVRDAALALVRRPCAAGHVRLWTDLVRRCPEPLLAPPATLLGWSAWQDGRGALAWCAVERAVRVDPGYTLLTYLASALEHALPPAAWDDLGDLDWRLGLVS